MRTPVYSGVTYRPHIDGLRAIAVLAVFAFHLHPNAAPGGFVGVDIFFVISGFLVTKSLMKDLERDRFTYLDFYTRRICRILPVFFLVLACTFVIAYWYLLPADFEDFGRSIVAAALSCSNFFFFAHAGYFQSDGLLLHTWSLGVEEQFYILFPIFLFLGYRYKRTSVKLLIAVAAGLSFAVSMAFEKSHPVANFFMPYTRAWELLLGAFLSLEGFQEISSRFLREVFAFAGASLIVLPMLLYSEAMIFPGPTALPPCLGAAILIGLSENHSTIVHRALATRPLVFIGLISYSLYLWHWPLIMLNSVGFLRIRSLPHSYSMVLLVAVSFILSYLSWKFVEIPFRNRRAATPRNRIFLEGGCVVLLLVLMGTTVVGMHGLAYRFPPAALRVASQGEASLERVRSGQADPCFISGRESLKDFSFSHCLAVNPVESNYLLLGDSHAQVLWHSMAQQFQQVNVMQASAAGCKPFPDQPDEGGCRRLMNFVYGKFLPGSHIEGLVLSARWKASDLPQIARVADWCRARNIPLIVVGPAEEYDAPLPTLLAFSIRDGNPSLPFRHRITDLENLDREMRNEAATRWHVPYVSLIRTVCTNVSCRDYADAGQNYPMLFDQNHYTEQGASYVIASAASSGQLRLVGKQKAR